MVDSFSRSTQKRNKYVPFEYENPDKKELDFV